MNWLNAKGVSIIGGESFNLGEEDPKIIYDVEAFLFQVKCCLDVLNQLIGIVFIFIKQNIPKWRRNIVTELKKELP
jgi:hypothetical protein